MRTLTTNCPISKTTMTKTRKANNPRLMRPMALFAAFLASGQNQVDGFSMVSPPSALRSVTLPSEWKTNTFHPIPLVEPEAFEFAKSLLEKTEPPRTVPAHLSPLFRGDADSSRRPKLRYTTPSQLKSRIVKDMAEFVVKELDELQIARERKVLLEALGTDTFDLIKTGRKVVEIQDNLQHVWDAAGEAMIGFGLSDAATLPVFTASRQQEEVNLFDSFTSDENFFDLITYTDSSSNTNA